MKKIISILLTLVFLLFSTAVIPVNATITDDSATGTYVDVTQVGALTAERQKVVDYMHSMATIKWTCGKYIYTGYDEYYAGNTYYGIPYDQKQSSAYGWVSLSEFQNMIKNGKTIDTRIGRNDCSSAVSDAMRQVDSKVVICTTPGMRPGANGFISVGTYEWVNTKNHASDKTATCNKNGKAKMFEAYALMQPGDMICRDGHAMMISYNNPKTKKVKIIHQSSGNYVYNPNNDTCSSRGKGQNQSPRNSSWGVNQELSYEDLFTYNHAVPLTCSGLANSSTKVSKPSAPTSVSLKSTALGKGDTLVASWGKVAGATAYNVKLICSTNSANNQTKNNISGTSASFTLKNEGTYYVTVSATNSAGTSSATKSTNATVYKNYTVKWIDYDGTVLKTQTVKYNGNATNPPASPTRIGYSFQGWDKSANNIKSDTTITATYKINTYSVTFVDYNNNTIGNAQRVEHGQSATAPTDIPTEQGYKFIGWNSEDYKNVTKSLTVVAVYEWENTDLPINMSITSAKRNEEATGYDVTVKIANFPDDFTKGKIVVALKTKEGKMVASETRTISLPSSKECTEQLHILYSGIVTNAEVSMVGVVDDETTGTPKAKSISTAIDIGNEWSDWSVNKPANDVISESRTEYRYKDKLTKKDTAQPATPAGYTFVSSAAIKDSYTAWSSWSAYSTTKQTPSALKEEGKTTGYRYYAFVCSSCGQRDPYSGKCSKCQKTGTLKWNEIYYEKIGSSAPSTASFDGSKGVATINSKKWYWEKPGTSNGQSGTGQPTKTMYRYRTRKQYYNYNYIQTNFSDWQITVVSASDTRQVETRTTYRFKTNNIETPCYHYKRYTYTNLSNGNTVYSYSSVYPDSMGYPGYWEYYNTIATELDIIQVIDDGVNLYNGYGENSWYSADVNNESDSVVYETVTTFENTEGVRRHLEGTLQNAPNKVVTLLVYKGQNTDPTASQIEFIGQTTTDANGVYSFDYITKEEPTIQTGDFVITIGVEGSTNYLTVGKIEAPKPIYTVDFFLEDGTYLSTSNVLAGGSVEAPEAPEIGGYEFVGWDTALKNIQENTIVEAIYREKTCMVVFVDWDESFISMKEFEYGSELTADTLPEKEGQMFDCWNDFDNQLVQVVTDDMIVCAKYNDAVYTVTFFDADGNIISEQELAYGEEATAPQAVEAPSPNLVFEKWDSDGEEQFVTRSMAINPEFKYVQTSAAPQMTVASGTYEETQTVGMFSLAANTKIYYCILDADASDVVYLSEELFNEYEAPIEITDNSIIYAYAETAEMNKSDYSVSTILIGEQSPEITLGDVDEDGVVNIFDATEIQLYLAKYKDLTDTQMLAADADRDGIVNIYDVTQIQLYLAKYITEL